jgi:hydrogenase maturation protein HypF
MELSTYNITITGRVQGVGFRPFVYTLAMELGLTGNVSNRPEGVSILLNATQERVTLFVKKLQSELPPLATIDTIGVTIIPMEHFKDFQIIATQNAGQTTVQIPPDLSLCPACETELFDKTNRRYGYPFITCTHCGVRYSMIENLPYDRASTSMKFFTMCNACEAEYTNPLDRRYHAQPIGCWECGPTLKLYNSEGVLLNIEVKQMVSSIAKLILEGHIVAIKGVGGYHLVCDATNNTVVHKLRERKHRPTKPFALMVPTLAYAKELAYINTKEEALLTSQARPIVLLKQKSQKFSTQVAPKLTTVGLFLPYTPLHLLLMKALNRPLVATSANITDEPLCTNLESLRKLSGVYDYALEHTREIVNGCDDSVVQVVGERNIMLRRARGYAPVSIKSPLPLPQKVLALGANQKSTVAIGFDNEIICSPHIGDLDGIASVEYFTQNIETLQRIYNFTPQTIMCDMHPNYESTKYAKAHFSNSIEVQHHYAHILGVMAEKGLTGNVLGIAFDGTGYGDDGNLWGGECFICDEKGYERVAHLSYFKLLGGTKAIKEPRRVALSFLFALYGKEALALNNPTIEAFRREELETLYIAWQKSLNAPLSSSAGRLFDAVASLLGVCQVISYEGESGLRLEELYDTHMQESYPFHIVNQTIDVLPLFEAILHEQNSRTAVSKFFNTLVEIVYTLSQRYSNLPVVLSGGVFQNRTLLKRILEKLPQAYTNEQIPPNDGGIALGQCMASVAR